MSSRRRSRRSRLVLHFLLPFGVFHSASGAESAPAFVEPGKVIWSGRPDALSPAGGPRAFDLSPDARSIVYLQGDPWPRVMLVRLGEGLGAGPSEPIPLARTPWWGTRPPRFGAGGRHVFFTADGSFRSTVYARRPVAERAVLDRSIPGRPISKRAPAVSPPPATAPETVQLAVVRAQADGGGTERLLPAPGAPADDAAVFLDVHPDGRTILAGTASALRASDVSSGEFSWTLVELSFDETGDARLPARPLGLAVHGQALVRYSWDGAAIYYGEGPEGGDPSAVRRYLRAGGVSEPAACDQHSVGWLAGDVEVVVHPFPHPGSFGWDGFPLVFLSRGLAPTTSGAAVPFRAPDSLRAPDALRAPLPLFPVSVRGNRMLLAGGFEDRIELAVAEWDPARFGTALASAALAADPLVRARGTLGGFGTDEMRAAAADPKAAGLLQAIRSTSVLLPGPPLRSARARWTRRNTAAGDEARWAIEATEIVPGGLRIDRTHPPPEPEAPPVRDSISWNGHEAWATNESAGEVPISPGEFLTESAVYSPLRLLIDPAGTALPGSTFYYAGESEPGPSESRRLALLDVRAAGGYRAQVGVEVAAGRALVVRIETPLLLAREKMRREFGDLPAQKTIRFDEHRPAGGRLVPGRIRFDDGIAPFELTLEGLEINPPDAVLPARNVENPERKLLSPR